MSMPEAEMSMETNRSGSLPLGIPDRTESGDLRAEDFEPAPRLVPDCVVTLSALKNPGQ